MQRLITIHLTESNIQASDLAGKILLHWDYGTSLGKVRSDCARLLQIPHIESESSLKLLSEGETAAILDPICDFVVLRRDTPLHNLESCIKKVTFTGSNVGLSCWPNTGVISKVHQGGLAFHYGVKVGMVVARVEGKTFTMSRLVAAMCANRPFEVEILDIDKQKGAPGDAYEGRPQKTPTTGEAAYEERPQKRLRTNNIALLPYCKLFHGGCNPKGSDVI